MVRRPSQLRLFCLGGVVFPQSMSPFRPQASEFLSSPLMDPPQVSGSNSRQALAQESLPGRENQSPRIKEKTQAGAGKRRQAEPSCPGLGLRFCFPAGHSAEHQRHPQSCPRPPPAISACTLLSRIMAPTSELPFSCLITSRLGFC